MKILITGSEGYIGTVLVDYFKERIDVYSIDKNGGIGDVPYQGFYKETINEFEIVIHLAAHSTVDQCEKDPLGCVKNNFCDLIDFVRKLNPEQKFIYASSASVYTKTPKFYDFSKLTFDQFITLYRPKNSWGLRFGTVCGPSPKIRGTMLNKMVWDAHEYGRIEITNPNVCRPILGINDLVRVVGEIVDGHIEPGMHDLSSFGTTVAGAALAVSQVVGCDIILKPPVSTYDIDFKQSYRFTMRDTQASIILELCDFWDKNSKLIKL